MNVLFLPVFAPVRRLLPTSLVDALFDRLNQREEDLLIAEFKKITPQPPKIRISKSGVSSIDATELLCYLKHTGEFDKLAKFVSRHVER